MSSADQPPTEEDHFGELYHQLHHFYFTSDYARALQAGTELLSQEPEDAYLHYRVGECLRMLGQTHQAISHLKKSLSLAPDYADALNALGLCHLANNKAGLAYDHINKAVSLDPEDAFNWYSKGLCHLGFEHRKKVLQCAEQIRQLAPESVWSTDLEVRAHFDLDKSENIKREKRLAVILHALEVEPEKASYHARLAQLKLKEFNQVTEAETHAREALRLEPGDTDYRKLLIQVLREKDPVLRALRLPLKLMKTLRRRREVSNKWRMYAYGTPVALLLLMLAICIAFEWENGFMILLGSFLLIAAIPLLFALIAVLGVLFYAILCWPIAKAYEYLTIADVYKKAGDLSFYSKPMARFHQGPFALRMALFALIPLGFWSLLAALIYFHDVGLVLAIVVVYGLRFLGLLFFLSLPFIWIRKLIRKFKTR